MAIEQFVATGRRKEAVARVYLRPGTGKFIINKRDIEVYFPRETSKMLIRAPFEILEQEGKWDVKVNVIGGGLSGQAGAIRHGVSRALCMADPDSRPPLKKAGFMTRDARAVERKKYGKPGARKRFQFSKR